MTQATVNPNTGKPVGGKHAACFTWMLPEIVRIGFEHGYAIAVHGSMQRDLDLIAVPWVQDAKPADDLVAALASRFSASQHIKNPTAKPHGRLAYSIHFGAEPYIDLSVVPTQLPGKAWLDLREAVREVVLAGPPIGAGHPLEKLNAAFLELWHSEITPGRPH